jgi:hypothetical protein
MTRLGFEEAAMNDKTASSRGPRRARALAFLAAVAVLATACGSSAPSAGSALGGSVTYPQELALAQCMRGHGEPDFPDPAASGGFNASVLSTFDNSQGQAAYGACRHLLASGGPSIAQLQQQLQQVQQRQQKALLTLLKFSQCVRAHGVPNWPDPTLTAQGISLNLKATGLSLNSPQVQAAMSACQHVAPGLSLSAHSSMHTS